MFDELRKGLRWNQLRIFSFVVIFRRSLLHIIIWSAIRSLIIFWKDSNLFALVEIELLTQARCRVVTWKLKLTETHWEFSINHKLKRKVETVSDTAGVADVGSTPLWFPVIWHDFWGCCSLRAATAAAAWDLARPANKENSKWEFNLWRMLNRVASKS